MRARSLLGEWYDFVNRKHKKSQKSATRSQTTHPLIQLSDEVVEVLKAIEAGMKPDLRPVALLSGALDLIDGWRSHPNLTSFIEDLANPDKFWHDVVGLFVASYL